MDELRNIEDRYRRRENISEFKYSYFNDGHLFMLQERERQLIRLIKKYGMIPLKGKKILDVGCGDGSLLRCFIQYGAEPRCLYGVDILEKRIKKARELSPNINLFQCNAEALDFPDESFDIIIQSTVFTSIFDANLKRNIANEMKRLLKDDGIIIWYDFIYNNAFNKDVRGIKKKEIEELFSGCILDYKRITLAPPIARLLAKKCFLACYILALFPFLRTHYLIAIRKRNNK